MSATNFAQKCAMLAHRDQEFRLRRTNECAAAAQAALAAVAQQEWAVTPPAAATAAAAAPEVTFMAACNEQARAHQALRAAPNNAEKELALHLAVLRVRSWL